MHSSSAQHRDRYLLGVELWFTKICGSGMDCMFMGTVTLLPVPPNTARVWVSSSGAIVSIDNVFGDWFAYKTDELAGQVRILPRCCSVLCMLCTALVANTLCRGTNAVVASCIGDRWHWWWIRCT